MSDCTVLDVLVPKLTLFSCVGSPLIFRMVVGKDASFSGFIVGLWKAPIVFVKFSDVACCLHCVVEVVCVDESTWCTRLLSNIENH